MITDIRFACTECGKYMIADSTAAGLAADCPHCGRSLTVPAFDGDESLTNHARDGSDADQSQLHQRLEASLAECERMAAAGTLAQAEIKSFHAERRTLKAELTQTRQRLSIAEAQLAEHAQWLAGTHAAAQQLEAERESLRTTLGIVKERVAATDTQLSFKEQQVTALSRRMEELEAAHTLGQAEIISLQEESALLHRDLDLTRAALAEARETKRRGEEAQTELARVRWELDASEELGKALLRERDLLRNETAALRADLNETDSGRELVRLRSLVAELEQKSRRLEVDNNQITEDLRKAEADSDSLQKLFKATCLRLQDAEKRAEECSEERLKQDNMALRGIIARQNNELESRRIELHRFRRARLAMRLVYGLVSLGIVILLIAAVNTVASLEW